LGFAVVCFAVGDVVVDVVLVIIVDGGDIVVVGAFVVDDVCGALVVVFGDQVFDVADIVDAVDDKVVISVDMVEIRVVGIVDKASRVWPHILMFVMET